MSKLGDVRWARWAGTVVGVLVLFKVVRYVVSKVISVTKNEVQARGGDVSFVLGMAERRSRALRGSR